MGAPPALLALKQLASGQRQRGDLMVDMVLSLILCRMCGQDRTRLAFCQRFRVEAPPYSRWENDAKDPDLSHDLAPDCPCDAPCILRTHWRWTGLTTWRHC